MKHRPDVRGLLYFAIAVLTVWSGELGNLSGPDLFTRIQERWPVLADFQFGCDFTNGLTIITTSTSNVTVIYE